MRTGMRIRATVRRVCTIAVVATLGALGVVSPAQAAAASRSWNYNQILAGDCVQRDGVLTIDSDGVATYTATVWTDHTWSKDVWWGHFEFRGAGGRVLYVSPTMESVEMRADGIHHPLNWRFTFPPQVYWQTLWPTQYYTC
jgi:hypothetical protein